MPHYPKEIEYSDKYVDELFEYRHVILPKEVFKTIRTIKTLSEDEWRNIGVKQSKGWVHYMIYQPEPHILLFRRPIGTDPATGKYPDNFKHKLEIYLKKKNSH